MGHDEGRLSTTCMAHHPGFCCFNIPYTACCWTAKHRPTRWELHPDYLEPKPRSKDAGEFEKRMTKGCHPERICIPVLPVL